MKQLYEKDQVFGVVGNVGTPTAAVGLPYALDRKMLFFGAFTGAGLLRSDPPDRYVFNYRASYAEETEAVVNYLVKVRRLKPDADCRLCPAGRVRRFGLRRRSQSYPFARSQQQRNFAAQLPAQHRGCGRGGGATQCRATQKKALPDKGGDHGAHLSGRGKVHREDAAISTRT